MHSIFSARRLASIVLTATALAGLFIVTGAPNRRAHDHIGNFGFAIDIEGVNAGYVVAVAYTKTNGCPIVDVDRMDFATQVERDFEAAVAAGNDRVANALGTLSNALMESEGTPSNGEMIPLRRVGVVNRACAYRMRALPSAQLLLDNAAR